MAPGCKASPTGSRPSAGRCTSGRRQEPARAWLGRFRSSRPPIETILQGCLVCQLVHENQAEPQEAQAPRKGYRLATWRDGSLGAFGGQVGGAIAAERLVQGPSQSLLEAQSSRQGERSADSPEGQGI